MSEPIDMKQFIPTVIKSGILGNTYETEISELQNAYHVRYWRSVSNWTGPRVGWRKLEDTIPKTVSADTRTFEVLGLLQGEMSKTYRGPLTFANCRPELIQLVLEWFDEQFSLPPSQWHWYIKLNIPPPANDAVAGEMAEQLSEYWLGRVRLSYDRRYPRTVSFITNTSNLIPKNEGTLILERRAPIFVQTIQRFVYDMTRSILMRSDEDIVAYMRGIIAAEGCINFRRSSGHFRVFITATDHEEREIFRQCLHRLGIATNDCKAIKDIVISRRENILKLHDLGLMTLNQEKHERFLEMIHAYRSSESQAQSL